MVKLLALALIAGLIGDRNLFEKPLLSAVVTESRMIRLRGCRRLDAAYNSISFQTVIDC